MSLFRISSLPCETGVCSLDLSKVSRSLALLSPLNNQAERAIFIYNCKGSGNSSTYANIIYKIIAETTP